MKELKNLVLYRIEAIEDKVENEKEILVSKFEEQIRSKNAEMAAMKTDLQKMKIAKNIFENDNMSKDKEITEINMKLKRLNNLIEEETKSRTYFNKELEKKSSHFESKMTDIISKNSNPDFENIEKKYPCWKLKHLN